MHYITQTWKWRSIFCMKQKKFRKDNFLPPRKKMALELGRLDCKALPSARYLMSPTLIFLIYKCGRIFFLSFCFTWSWRIKWESIYEISSTTCYTAFLHVDDNISNHLRLSRSKSLLCAGPGSSRIQVLC